MPRAVLLAELAGRSHDGSVAGLALVTGEGVYAGGGSFGVDTLLEARGAGLLVAGVAVAWTCIVSLPVLGLELCLNSFCLSELNILPSRGDTGWYCCCLIDQLRDTCDH